MLSLLGIDVGSLLPGEFSSYPNWKPPSMKSPSLGRETAVVGSGVRIERLDGVVGVCSTNHGQVIDHLADRRKIGLLQPWEVLG